MADADIFQQYRNAGDGNLTPVPAPPATIVVRPSADTDIFQQYRSGPQDTTAPPPLTTPATQQPEQPPDTIAPSWRAWIAPAPNTTYGSVLPLARDDATGNLRLALPSSLRSMATGALDLAEGPITGTVTPEATNLLLQGALAGRVTPSVARGTGVDIATAAARPPPVTGVNPLDPAAVARAAADAGPTSTVPPVATDMPRIVQTSADAKKIAGAYYDIAASKGDAAALTPEASGKMIDAASAVGQQGEAGQAVAGKNAVSDIQSRLEALRGKSLTLKDVQEMDEAMTGRIQQEYKTGSDKVAGQLKDIQSAWRDIYGNAGSGDVVGGTDGFAALQPARQAWSTAMKMQDVEQMQERASGMQNPTSSFKTYVNNFVNNPNKSRGWSDDEIAALKDAADRGAVGGLLHILGSRLIPHVAGAVGANMGAGIGGIPGALVGFGIGEGGSYALGGAARAAANALAAGRVGRLYGTLGEGAPAPPPGSSFAPAPTTVNPLQPAVGAAVPALVPPAYQQGRTVMPSALWWLGAS